MLVEKLSRALPRPAATRTQPEEKTRKKRHNQPEIQSQTRGDDRLHLVVCAVRSTLTSQASELAVQIGGTMAAIFPNGEELD